MIDQWKSSNGCIRVAMSRSGMIIHGTKEIMKKVRFHPVRQVLYLTKIHPYIEVEEKINTIKPFLATPFKHKIKAVKERQHRRKRRGGRGRRGGKRRKEEDERRGGKRRREVEVEEEEERVGGKRRKEEDERGGGGGG
ncbi:hypothetical protein AWC38_SpisGene17598 [Stylophora pistillata]|uniref:Uncharacterized protein n=1 Tax=Stylophora pistillata TaxID=50429 RepID=A0A2B4RP84_STYPI|nr:hypothetical protein AWC38_SpisGene17598 [Stylophora pistillata]